MQQQQQQLFLGALATGADIVLLQLGDSREGMEATTLEELMT